MANIPTREFVACLLAVEDGTWDVLNQFAKKSPMVEAALVIAGRLARTLAEDRDMSPREFLRLYALQLADQEPEGAVRG